MPRRGRRYRQVIPQFIPRESQTKAIQAHHVLDREERHIMPIDVRTKLVEFSIPHVKGGDTYPPIFRKSVNCLSTFQAYHKSSWSVRKI